jgi:SAM-dependent methyltransferase
MNNPSYSTLVAKYYDLFLQDNIEDIEFFKKYILGNYKKVLELGCGTGRLLIPLLKSGVSIDGLDNSSEMISILENKLTDQKTKIYNQSMDSFMCDDLYDLIFIGCGSFMLLDYEKGLRCLDSIKNNLKPDGEILIDLFIPWDDINKKSNNSFDVVRNVSVSDERCLVYELFEIDIMNQTKKGTYKYEKYVNGILSRTEVNNLDIRWYYENEIYQLLQEKGFSNVTTHKTNSEYIPNDTFMISANK